MVKSQQRHANQIKAATQIKAPTSSQLGALLLARIKAIATKCAAIASKLSICESHIGPLSEDESKEAENTYQP